MYYGYCQRSRQYRMMDLPDYMSNMQEGMSRMVTDTATAYQNMFRDYPTMWSGAPGTLIRRHHDCDCGGHHGHHGHQHDCGCRDARCECCVCDADVLIHARCGEVRRIPLTFENDTRRDRPVTLEIGKFLTSGGRDLGWSAQLSETQFTLHPCDEHTVKLLVTINCTTEKGPNDPATPRSENIAGTPRSSIDVDASGQRIPGGSVDRCEVGYATIRAEGCLTRPVTVAIAVLPDDCDDFRHSCGCSCCH